MDQCIWPLPTREACKEEGGLLLRQTKNATLNIFTSSYLTPFLLLFSSYAPTAGLRGSWGEGLPPPLRERCDSLQPPYFRRSN